MKQSLLAPYVGIIFGAILFGCIFSVAPVAHADTAITTCAELQAMRNDRTEHYYLANDIDCTGFDANSDGKGFEPIGTSTDPFTGTFNGNNHTISHIRIARPDEDNVSIFGYVHAPADTTTLQNFTVTGTIEGHNYVGALVDYADSGSNLVIDDVTSSVAVVGHGYLVAGLVGQSEAATTTISNAHVTGTVSVPDASIDVAQIGGLIGADTYALTISDSTVSGNVSVTTTGVAGAIGGLVGEFIGESIRNSSMTGNVTVHSDSTATGIGNLVGQLSASGSRVAVDSSHTTGTLSVEGVDVTRVSSFIGQVSSALDVTQSYSTGAIDVDASSSANYGIAGIIGSTSGGGGTIDKTFSTSKITAHIGGSLQHGVGGIVGYNFGDLAISNSFYDNTITVTSDSDYINGLGGIIGWSDGTNVTIDTSYAVSDLTSDASTLSGYIGGIAGHLAYGNSALSNVFYAGAISATAAVIDESTIEYVGEIAGERGYATLENIYWTKDQQGKSWYCSGSDYTYPDECIEASSAQYFKGTAVNAPLNAWNFSSAWEPVTGNFPNLQGLPAVHLAVEPRVRSYRSSRGSRQSVNAPQDSQVVQTASTTTSVVDSVPTLPHPSIVFTRTLKLGDSGDDVRQLQQFLNTHGFVVSATGPGSPGNETTMFGRLTQAAVGAFQEHYAAEILTPLGLTKGTGILGPATIKEIAALIGGQ